MPVAGRIFFELFDDAGSTYSAVSGSVLALIVGMSVMGLIGVVACTAPLLRALRIAPTEALKGGG